ncbi:hypothetical protein PC41400_04295 [Paenibacillus chitinolyticus]|uniref:Ig-like domain-containing protein n=1 Tax=Paenibacillus chitinolyticus TaxID=79263 RepID=A0A410WRM5_9BACL|nr:Ig-like domain-containing protein [Paenibacillus chitinolyticus]MCY9592119.1 Ig-like domain-containing protein [Paenibacillus chitinolyticus]MCY9598493.1 Ig-like domain-containing protein [Paenibacillus chitinolyticus]QAV16947.1 hypothetical protein PC41400_04295 [Paenibacillus chitinolyticus]
MTSVWNGWKKGFLFALVLLLGLVTFPVSRGNAASLLTIDSHRDGGRLEVGTVRIGGSYAGAYEVELVINGQKVADAHMDDPDGDDAGTWYYDLDTTAYDGEVELIARGKDTATRYNAWSAYTRLTVHNPAAGVPQVTITSPADRDKVSGAAVVAVNVYGASPVKSVEVRINGGNWKRAEKKGNGYSYKWDTKKAGTRTNSIEARATDVRGHTGRSLTTYVQTGGGDGTKPVTVLPRQDRSMWIWENASYNLIRTPGSRQVLDAMAKDTKTFGQDPVTTLYLGVDKLGGADMLEDERPEVRDFVRWAHAQGYRVQALIAGGTVPPYFGTYPRYREDALREFEKVLNYNLASKSAEQFDGVNVDTEPYSLPDFKTGYPDVQIQYLDMLAALMERKEASGLSLPVGPAIPRWYDSSDTAKSITWNGSTKWLSEHIQDTADYIAIMDYRDQADGSVGIIQQAQGEIDYANKIGKPNSVILGVETKDIADGGDPETISFSEEGRSYMERELDKVYAAFEGNAAFGGIALHHYDTLRALPSAWGPGARFWQPPADNRPPSGVKGKPQAAAFDYQRIDLTYGRATDNMEVEGYKIYRSTVRGFKPAEELLAGTARGLTFKDDGLLPDTVYYYRVAAVDASGNEGPASPEVSAKTGVTGLKPMIVDGMQVTYDGTRATVRLKTADMRTGEPVAAAVHGRFTRMGGKYVDGRSAADGTFTAVSELVQADSGEIGFAPRRVMAGGYYWAHAYDKPREASAVWGGAEE